MKNLVLVLISLVSIGFTSNFAHAKSACETSRERFEDIIRAEGGSLEVYYDCVMSDDNGGCSDEVKDVIYDGYSSEMIYTIIEFVGDYKLCKILND